MMMMIIIIMTHSERVCRRNHLRRGRRRCRRCRRCRHVMLCYVC